MERRFTGQEYAMFSKERLAETVEAGDPLTDEERQVYMQIKKDRAKRVSELERAGQESPYDSFVGLDDQSTGNKEFSREKIEENMQAVYKAKTSEREGEKIPRGEILEHLVRELIYNSEWLGNNCFCYETTEFDDRFNQADLVLEWIDENEQPIANCSIDFANSKKHGYLNRKAEKIKKGLDANTLGTVKFFESEKSGFKGRLRRVPQATISMSSGRIKHLCHDHLNKSKKEMAENPTQLVIIEQLKSQLGDQLVYKTGELLERIDQSFYKLEPKARDEIKNILAHIKELKEGHKELRGNILSVVGEILNQSNLARSSLIKRELGAINALQKTLSVMEKLHQEKSSLFNASEQKHAAFIGRKVVPIPTAFKLPPGLLRKVS